MGLDEGDFLSEEGVDGLLGLGFLLFEEVLLLERFLALLHGLLSEAQFCLELGRGFLYGLFLG